MHGVVNVKIKEQTRFFETKTRKDLRIEILLLTVLGDLPGIRDNRTVVFDHRYSVLPREGKLVFLGKTNRYGRERQLLIRQNSFGSPAKRAEAPVVGTE